jgi:hypothetical protein
MTSNFLNSAKKAFKSTSSSTDPQGREISSPIQSSKMSATANGTPMVADSLAKPAVVCVLYAPTLPLNDPTYSINFLTRPPI